MLQLRKLLLAWESENNCEKLFAVCKFKICHIITLKSIQIWETQYPGSLNSKTFDLTNECIIGGSGILYIYAFASLLGSLFASRDDSEQALSVPKPTTSNL